VNISGFGFGLGGAFATTWQMGCVLAGVLTLNVTVPPESAFAAIIIEVKVMV